MTTAPVGRMRRAAFDPPWWLAPRHIQTVLPNALRWPTQLPLTREVVELPDGDFVHADWMPGDTGPIVALLHGLEGNIRSPYASGMLVALHRAGFRAVLLHFRGCSGVPNRLPRAYHSGDYEHLPVFFDLVRKRAVWLTVLFVGQFMTTAAMGYFEDELARAVVLALFIPLVISSGGNSGSQASTLVIRAMAMEEIRLRDWWRVMRREVVIGLLLGIILGGIGLARVTLLPGAEETFGKHFVLLGATVSLSLVWIVMWGATAGAMLPFVLRRMGFDPASASAPFVATLVDVTGLVIYFSVATLLLRGTLL